MTWGCIIWCNVSRRSPVLCFFSVLLDLFDRLSQSYARAARFLQPLPVDYCITAALNNDLVPFFYQLFSCSCSLSSFINCSAAVATHLVCISLLVARQHLQFLSFDVWYHFNCRNSLAFISVFEPWQQVSHRPW